MSSCFFLYFRNVNHGGFTKMLINKLANVTWVTLALATAAFGQAVTLDSGSQIDYFAHLGTGASYINVQNDGANAGNICANVYAWNAQTTQLVMCCSVLVGPQQTDSINLTTDLERLGNSLFPDSATVHVVANSPANGSTPCNAATGPTTTTVLTFGMTAWKRTIQLAQDGVTNVSTEKALTPFLLSAATLSTDTAACAAALNNKCPSAKAAAQ
jgi:hypothetical protein